MSLNKSKVVFIPNWSKNNPYQNLLAESLSDSFNVVMSDIPQGLRPFTSLYVQHSDMKVLHIHWLTEIIHRLSWSSNPVIFYIKLGLIIHDLKKLQKKGVKVVWTIHNKLAHQAMDASKELIIRRYFSDAVDRIILHSKPALEIISQLYNKNLNTRSSVIFHGNYEGCYPEPNNTYNNIRKKLDIDIDQSMILFFGSIRPYKGIEQLIEAFKGTHEDFGLELHLAGNIPDETYKQKLLNEIQTVGKIHYQFEYITDQDLSNLLFVADVVVIPFVDTLTSGSVILAMTMGKALILPEAAKVFDCVPDEGVFYFNDINSLRSILEKLDQDKLKVMGHKNKLAAEQLSWKTVGKLTTDAYQTEK